MKSVTEFPSFRLTQGLTTKAALAAEGKTPEEIEAGLGEKFKLEGDKLKYFINALEVAGQNAQSLSRVLVVSLGEGENVPAKAMKVEELHYVPEFQIQARPAGEKSLGKGGPGKGRSGGRGGGGGGPKESPWGMSPEQKAAKKAGGNKAAKPS
jgi:hypothetical protein